MAIFELIAVLLVLTSAFAWVNHRYIRLPQSIGLLLFGLVASILLLGLELWFTDVMLYQELTTLVRQVHFKEAVLQGMLGFLLFAGALNVDASRLRSRAYSVSLMATGGVLISTAVVGYGAWRLARIFGADLPFAWALVFGALISPTDPIAVLSTLKEVRVPKELETDMAGESLFNDGVGVVTFTIVAAIASAGQGGQVGLSQVAELFFHEALGGAILGLVSGFIAYRGIRAIDDFPVEILISLGLVTGTYVRRLDPRLHLRLRLRHCLPILYGKANA